MANTALEKNLNASAQIPTCTLQHVSLLVTWPGGCFTHMSHFMVSMPP